MIVKKTLLIKKFAYELDKRAPLQGANIKKNTLKFEICFKLLFSGDQLKQVLSNRFNPPPQITPCVMIG